MPTRDESQALEEAGWTSQRGLPREAERVLEGLDIGIVAESAVTAVGSGR
jgi:hypothetical protein